MTLKKINLSALSANTPSPKEEVPKINPEVTWKQEIPAPVSLVPEVKVEKISPVLKTPEETSTRKKISLKDLKKTYTQSVSEVLKAPSEPTLIQENEDSPWVPLEASTKSVIEVIETSHALTMEEPESTQEVPNISVVSQEQEDSSALPEIIQPQAEEIFTITDGDTNCSIVKEEKSEIFWSYKWSFSQTIEEDIVPEVSVIEAPVVAIPAETISSVWNSREERKIDPTKTNLERYIDGKENTKKITKKKILLSGMVSILALWVPGAMFLPWGLLKSNVLETPTNITKETPPTETTDNTPSIKAEEITPMIEENTQTIEVISPNEMGIETNQIWNNEMPPPPEEAQEVAPIIGEDSQIIEVIPPNEVSPEITIENNQIWNPNIVKENEVVEVDNLRKNTKIDPKVQNYLLQKYKK